MFKKSSHQSISMTPLNRPYLNKQTMLYVVITSLLLAAIAPEVELQKAVMKSDLNTVKKLIKNGAKQILGEQSCLMIAGYMGSVEIVDELLRHIPNNEIHDYVNKKGTVGSNTGNALLFTLLGAEEKPDPQKWGIIIEKLSKQGIELNSIDSRGRTPTMIAFSLADVNLIRSLSSHESFANELGYKPSSGPFKGRNAMSFLTDTGRYYVQTCTQLLFHYNKKSEGKRLTQIAKKYIKNSDDSWAMHPPDLRTCSHRVLWEQIDEFIAEVLETVFELTSDKWSCKRLLRIKQLASSQRDGKIENITTNKMKTSNCNNLPLQSTCHDFDVLNEIQTVNSINEKDFENNFYKNNIPLIIKHATTDWNCNSWSLQDVRQQLGNIRTTIAEIPYASQYGLPMREVSYNTFINDYIENGSSWYAFDNGLHSKVKNSMKFFQRHPVTGKRSFNPPQWSFGGNSSGSPTHFHQDAFNGVCFGEKIWKIWPPNSAFISTRTAGDIFDNFGEFPPHVTVTQHAGDLMYIPKGWGHAILNVGTTLAVAVEYY